jgi:hypothetical protein
MTDRALVPLRRRLDEIDSRPGSTRLTVPPLRP